MEKGRTCKDSGWLSQTLAQDGSPQGLYLLLALLELKDLPLLFGTLVRSHVWLV